VCAIYRPTRERSQFIYCAIRSQNLKVSDTIDSTSPAPYSHSVRLRIRSPALRIHCACESEASLFVFAAPASPKPRSSHVTIANENPHSYVAPMNANPFSSRAVRIRMRILFLRVHYACERVPTLRVQCTYECESSFFECTAPTNMNPHSSHAVRLWIRIPFLRMHCAYKCESPFFECFASTNANPRSLHAPRLLVRIPHSSHSPHQRCSAQCAPPIQCLLWLFSISCDKMEELIKKQIIIA